MTNINWIKYFQTPEHTLNSAEAFILRLKRSLYRLSEYLTSQGYVNNELCPCVFIKKSHSDFVIVAIYVDDMNLIGTPEELAHIMSEFEMRVLRKTRYCLGLEIEHRSDEILVHQSNYT